PKAVQSILGHASAAFTLTVYGHLFEADLDAVADALERGVRVEDTGQMRGNLGAEFLPLPHRDA
ncbi:MAG: hypothetical protein M3P43_14830, partial [Actinomycetota bacterium]|nr:hypothetical protein [Actinomycetota bacterium]